MEMSLQLNKNSHKVPNEGIPVHTRNHVFESCVDSPETQKIKQMSENIFDDEPELDFYAHHDHQKHHYSKKINKMIVFSQFYHKFGRSWWHPRNVSDFLLKIILNSQLLIRGISTFQTFDEAKYNPENYEDMNESRDLGKFK